MKKDKKNIPIVFMVAGMSSRFGGIPKPFVQVGPNNETLIEIMVDYSIKNGFGKIVFIVGDKTENLFKSKFGVEYKGKPVFYAKQSIDAETRDKPWGTCEAVVLAKDFIDDDFVVCNGDDFHSEEAIKMIFDFISNNDVSAAVGGDLIESLPDIGTVNRGVFFTDEKGYINEIKEVIGISKENYKQHGLFENNLVNHSIMLLNRKNLLILEKYLVEFKLNHDGDRKSECYLPVELSRLIKSGNIIIKLLRAPENLIGVTNPGDELILKKFLTEKLTTSSKS